MPGASQGSEHGEVCPLGGRGRSTGSSWGTVTHQVLAPTGPCPAPGGLGGAWGGVFWAFPLAPAGRALVPELCRRSEMILSVKMQHDVLVSYNPLNPSQASALWGFRCK